MRPIANGITTCNNCNRIFDTCAYNRILSAAWECRRNGYEYVEQVWGKCGLTENEATMVQISIDKDYCHDEFIRHINKMTIDLEAV